MAVIIQEFCPAEKSGIWIGKGKNKGILEWTFGTGDKLVLGKVTPKTEEFPNNKLNNLMINNKNVGDIILEYQKKIDAPCDFEWCIAENKLIMLQYRPVTTNIPDKQKNLKGDITGTPASAGFVHGKVCLLEDEEEIENFEEGSILLTYYTDPHWVTAMTKSCGIITSQGGFLCHTAIIARELGIPCITGIGYKNLKFLAKQKEITLDATNGVINVKKNEKFELIGVINK